MEAVVKSVLTHAGEVQPNECCGLVVRVQNGLEYVRCTNVSSDPTNGFVISPEEFAFVEDRFEVVMVAHSHVFITPAPSGADMAGIERLGLPWLIVNYPCGTHSITNPTGFKLPLLGRQFCKGLVDCYALVRDYYSEKLSIELPDYVRPEVWHEEGRSILVENFEAFGFRTIDMKDLKPNDCLLMQIGATVPNHCAVYVGENKILHHVTGRLSGYDVYGGLWRKATTHYLRYVG